MISFPSDCDFLRVMSVTMFFLPANPCIYYDEYTNCKMLKQVHGCGHPSVALLCRASCLCNTEIT